VAPVLPISFTESVVGVSSLANALGYPGGRCLVAWSNGGVVEILVVYQAGAQGATGLVYQQSDDQAVSWDGEVQVSNRQGHLPAIVLNPDTGDVHVVYSILGDPALAVASSTEYCVLNWNGVDWSVGIEKELYTAAAASALSNLSLDQSGGYLAALAHLRYSTTARWIYSIGGPVQWDLFTGAVKAAEKQQVNAVEVRLVHVADDALANRYLISEQGGTFTLWQIDEYSPGSLNLTELLVWYADSTAEFAAAYHPGLGKIGIVQINGAALEYREFDPVALTLGDAVVVDDSDECYWPDITVDFDQFVVAYTRDTGVADVRDLVAVWSGDWVTNYTLATDPAAEAWGAVHLARDTAQGDGLYVAWCDTVDSAVDGEYEIHVGRADILVAKAVTDDIAALEFIPAVVQQVADVGAFVESLRAGEPKAATDSIAAAEALATWQVVADAAAIAETFLVNYRVSEGISFADAFRLSMPVADAGAVADVVRVVWKIVVGDAIAATDAVAQLKVAVADAMSADDQLAPFGIPVAEAIAVSDVVGIWVDVAEAVAAADVFGINQAILDGASVTEIIGMTYEIIESAVAAEGLVVSQAVVEPVSATDVILRLEVHSDSTIHAADSLAKLNVFRIGIRLHMHSGQARLRMEGGKR
jgi:hypothetical protein